eukprot:257937-Chlamydomonas_euryale.AAC.8
MAAGAIVAGACFSADAARAPRWSKDAARPLASCIKCGLSPGIWYQSYSVFRLLACLPCASGVSGRLQLCTPCA